jgi:uncharacterized protein (TIGR02145 family)
MTILSNAASITVKDADGNVYHTVKIGNQIWTVKNLRTTKCNDGSAIPLVTERGGWNALRTPGYCYYKNATDDYSIKKFGALYNWHAVNTGKLAPAGWHVPSNSEWSELVAYLGGDAVAGGKLKEAGTTHWRPSLNSGATNETGFAALPGGYRNNDGAFNNIGNYGNWWSSTANDDSYTWYRAMGYDYASVNCSNVNNDGYGFSVRCVRNP